MKKQVTQSFVVASLFLRLASSALGSEPTPVLLGEPVPGASTVLPDPVGIEVARPSGTEHIYAYRSFHSCRTWLIAPSRFQPVPNSHISFDYQNDWTQPGFMHFLGVYSFALKADLLSQSEEEMLKNEIAQRINNSIGAPLYSGCSPTQPGAISLEYVTASDIIDTNTVTPGRARERVTGVRTFFPRHSVEMPQGIPTSNTFAAGYVSDLLNPNAEPYTSQQIASPTGMRNLVAGTNNIGMVFNIHESFGSAELRISGTMSQRFITQLTQARCAVERETNGGGGGGSTAGAIIGGFLGGPVGAIAGAIFGGGSPQIRETMRCTAPELITHTAGLPCTGDVQNCDASLTDTVRMEFHFKDLINPSETVAVCPNYDFCDEPIEIERREFMRIQLMNMWLRTSFQARMEEMGRVVRLVETGRNGLVVGRINQTASVDMSRSYRARFHASVQLGSLQAVDHTSRVSNLLQSSPVRCIRSTFNPLSPNFLIENGLSSFRGDSLGACQ